MFRSHAPQRLCSNAHVRPEQFVVALANLPMTELASRFVEDGLNRLRSNQSTIAEPVAADPRDRTDEQDH